ncbi:hypothetical protein LPJ78_002423 [Coemansia sp. RSA 989]|nr:hypothetical protein LPJ68_002913 [Coemansia sp. RSA 1086]KAJ1748303.1 hypothetical protein LPJ79_004621 [Coemansia sp. RSA 1821]KAJ1865735.1 hypothetical protein LPJ78_002423 [Coemansia sp. RSA 989]KAJ1873657.1 hypothetical protein LPJ55_002108 [Coemansia sp. RSA 990]KAJ2671437.1 hypothetical protein IWW42_003396 [Coemansia sp. RSA 1085]
MNELSTVTMHGNLSPIGAGFNLVNTMIGSGILALPYALKEAGFYFGIFTMVLSSLLIYVALNVLVYGGRRAGMYRFESVSEAAMGRTGHHLLTFALAVNSIGSCISYLIIIGDTTSSVAQHVFGPSIYTSRQATILYTAIGFTLPLLFFRTLEPLVKPSVLSTLCLPFIVVIVALRGPTYHTTPEPVPKPVLGPSALPAIGVIAFAYSCTQTSYQSYQTLRHKTLSGWRTASAFASSLAVVIYLAFSIISYQSFGLDTQPNLLNNFDNSDQLANVARVLLAFSLTLTYPMQFYPIRDLFGEALGLSAQSTSREARVKFNLFALAMFVATLVVALAVEDLGFVFKLIGTAAASLLVFGLPGIIYLRLVSPYFTSKLAGESSPLLDSTGIDIDEDAKHISEPSTTIMSCFLLVLGFVVFVVGTWTCIQEFVVDYIHK